MFTIRSGLLWPSSLCPSCWQISGQIYYLWLGWVSFCDVCQRCETMLIRFLPFWTSECVLSPNCRMRNRKFQQNHPKKSTINLLVAVESPQLNVFTTSWLFSLYYWTCHEAKRQQSADRERERESWAGNVMLCLQLRIIPLNTGWSHQQRPDRPGVAALQKLRQH